MITKQNCVIQGDAYETLRKISSDSVNLCYLDPPFFAKRTFEVETKDGKFNSFDDNWDNDIGKYLPVKVYSNLPLHASEAKFQATEYSKSLINVINLQVGLAPALSHSIYELATSSKELCEMDWTLLNNQIYDLGSRIDTWIDIKNGILKQLNKLK